MNGSELSCMRVCGGGGSDGWGPQGDLLTVPKVLQSLPTLCPRAVTGSRRSSGGGPGYLPGRPLPPLALFCMGVSKRPGGLRGSGAEATEASGKVIEVNSGQPVLPTIVAEEETGARRRHGELTALVVRCAPGESGCPGVNLALLPPRSCVTLGKLPDLSELQPPLPYPGAVLVPSIPRWSEVLGAMLPAPSWCSERQVPAITDHGPLS